MTSTRDQIIEKTCELLELQGYYATGVNQIIQESGSPKGSLYYHFPGGKEELAAESVKYVGDIVLNHLRTTLAEIDEPAGAIRKFIMDVAYNVELSGYRSGGPLTTIAVETASSSIRLREECHRIYTAWQSAFFDKLIQGGYGEDRAQRLAVLIIAALEGGIILCRTAQSRKPLEDAAQEIGDLIERTKQH